MNYLEDLENARYRLTDVGNTRNPALLVLQDKGYILGAYAGKGDEDNTT